MFGALLPLLQLPYAAVQDVALQYVARASGRALRSIERRRRNRNKEARKIATEFKRAVGEDDLNDKKRNEDHKCNRSKTVTRSKTSK